MSERDANERFATITARVPNEPGETFFDRDDVRAIYYREANVIVLYVDGIERGWWNATAWNQLQLGILVAPNIVRLQQGSFPVVDFSRRIELEPVGDEMFPLTIGES